MRIIFGAKFPQAILLLFLTLALASRGDAQQMAQQQLSRGPNSQPTSSSATNPPPADPVSQMLNQALQLLIQHQLDAALAKVNAAIQAAPKNVNAYELRGTIDVEKKLWDQAEKDYQTALQLDGKNIQLEFNIAEIQFMQKQYATARAGFAALQYNSDWGDIASYKVFLCDLFGGNENAAAKELDVFNQAGRNASYYFANVAWSLYHHKTEDARGWLTSAVDIYAPNKCRLYASSLINLGYLPLPPPPQR